MIILCKATSNFWDDRQKVRQILCQENSEFDNLIGASQCYSEEKKDKSQQQIIVPSYKIVQPVCAPKNQIIPMSYIKTMSVKQMMGPQKYQLDQTDICFLTKNFPFLTEQQFTKIIVSLQKQSFRYGSQMNYKKIIERILSQTLAGYQNEQRNVVIGNIYSYWRNKRKNLRSPMLRSFWKKNQMGPFKSRQENQHLFLRNRTVKVENQYIKQILKNDLQSLLKILNTMQKRESQERLLISSQTQNYQQICKKVLKKITLSNDLSLSKKQIKFEFVEKKKKLSQRKQKKSLGKKIRSKTVTYSSVKIYKSASQNSDHFE